MAVTVKVNGDDNSLVHKGSNHIARNTPPDVCKTPSPGGPVPIPYPVIISMSGDLSNGTTTVKVDGGNMAAVKGSELSRCSGDEAGTAGGVVSSTNMKEATWITYSMDVKMDGKNACRLTDKLKMNHGNTVCMVGIGGMPCRVTKTEITKALCQALCNYHNQSRDPKPSSAKLEDKCAENPDWARSGITFTKQFDGGKTIPDVVHEVGDPDATPPNGRRQCYDFKRCGLGPPRPDGSRKAWKDSFKGTQKARLRNVSVPPADPIEISCPKCTSCSPRCYCPKSQP